MPPAAALPMEHKLEQYIEQTLRPLLQGDGGDISYESFDGALLTVTLRGECSKCPIADRCLDWCAKRIEQDCGVRAALRANRRRPFFWDL